MIRQVVTVVGVQVLSRLASCGQPAVTVSQARSELLFRMLVMGKGTVARHLNPRVQWAADSETSHMPVRRRPVAAFTLIRAGESRLQEHNK